jgi:uncharacterized protein (UPF0276 family)
MGRGGSVRRALLSIAEKLPIAFHCVSLSIGSVDPLNWELLSEVKELAVELRAQWITDHVSYSSVNGYYFHDLLPLPFRKEAAHYVAERAKAVQDFFCIPFGLENPSYYKLMPGSEMSEGEFISEILNKSDCRFLLDVNNVYVNSFNHFDNPMESARQFLRSVPLEKVMEVHVAGHARTDCKPNQVWQPELLDNHGAAVSAPVRQLLLELNEFHPIKTLLLERENNLPPLDDIVSEVADIFEELSVCPKDEKSVFLESHAESNFESLGVNAL